MCCTITLVQSIEFTEILEEEDEEITLPTAHMEQVNKIKIEEHHTNSKWLKNFDHKQEQKLKKKVLGKVKKLPIIMLTQAAGAAGPVAGLSSGEVLPTDEEVVMT
ncbi:hypothetical protein DFH29DRAFT_878086 [Suillus ampliporus]|nr:hypothetical protein DFH29DRAFT_878086 [Suillus ampliporus]